MLLGVRKEGDVDGNYGESNIIYIVILNRVLRMERLYIVCVKRKDSKGFCLI